MHFAKGLVAALSVLAMVLAAGCSSSKQAVNPTAKTEIEVVDTAWHTLYAPVKVSLREPMAFSASGRATLVRDSLIHISIRILGMEVAQLRADNDSAWLVDRYHKMYTSVPLSSIVRSNGLTLGAVQDLLLGQGDLHGLVPAAAGTFDMVAGEFKKTPAGKVASMVEVAASMKNRNILVTLRWDLDKARWNGPVDTRWAIPDGCRRIPPEDLISSLKNL